MSSVYISTFIMFSDENVSESLKASGNQHTQDLCCCILFAHCLFVRLLVCLSVTNLLCPLLKYHLLRQRRPKSECTKLTNTKNLVIRLDHPDNSVVKAPDECSKGPRNKFWLPARPVTPIPPTHATACLLQVYITLCYQMTCSEQQFYIC